MIGRKSVTLTWSEREGVGYLSLPDHPKRSVMGSAKRSIDLRELDPSLSGPQIILDVDYNDRVIGIEILK